MWRISFLNYFKIGGEGAQLLDEREVEFYEKSVIWKSSTFGHYKAPWLVGAVGVWKGYYGMHLFHIFVVLIIMLDVTIIFL